MPGGENGINEMLTKKGSCSENEEPADTKGLRKSQLGKFIGIAINDAVFVKLIKVLGMWYSMCTCAGKEYIQSKTGDWQGIRRHLQGNRGSGAGARSLRGGPFGRKSV